METLKLWLIFTLVSKCMHMTILIWSSVSVNWRPVSKTYLVYAWLRDLIRGMRYARWVDSRVGCTALSRMAGSPLRSSWGSTMKSRCCDD